MADDLARGRRVWDGWAGLDGRDAVDDTEREAGGWAVWGGAGRYE